MMAKLLHASLRCQPFWATVQLEYMLCSLHSLSLAIYSQLNLLSRFPSLAARYEIM